MSLETDPTGHYNPIRIYEDMESIRKEVKSGFEDIKVNIEKRDKELRSDIRADLHEVVNQLKILNERHNQNDIWKAEINMRLGYGTDRMNKQDEDNGNKFKELNTKIDGCIKKETVVALVIGASMASGGGALMLLKLFGG